MFYNFFLFQKGEECTEEKSRGECLELLINKIIFLRTSKELARIFYIILNKFVPKRLACVWISDKEIAFVDFNLVGRLVIIIK